MNCNSRNVFGWQLEGKQGSPDSSVGKKSACNAGDPGWPSGLGRSAGEGIGYPFWYSLAPLVAQMIKEFACNAGDLGLIPGLGRCPREGNGFPIQNSGLENSTDKGAW